MTVAADEATTLGAAVADVRARLEAAAIPCAALDARVLVCGLLGRDAGDLIAHGDLPLDAAQRGAVEHGVARRLAREPVARILGHREFWSLRFRISNATLDPRPDSETAVAAALEAADLTGARDREMRIADLGTGSGCLIVALMRELPGAMGVAFDRSLEALRMARRNARDHGVAGRLGFVCTDWLAGYAGRFDMIVSNPPYVLSGDIATLQHEVSGHEPRQALDGGADGLDAYRRIAGQAHARLNAGGWLVLEVGDGQADVVSGLLDAAGFVLDAALPSQLTDLSGRVRCVRAARDH
ncbi:MAG: peptide chain release factor N(5)-glutamine methyltransferase [Hyphomicrobiales bacterium]